MTDKQKLTNAAKAAGYDSFSWVHNDYTDTEGYPRLGGTGTRKWNPEHDDGDAFRLMVDADICLTPLIDKGGIQYGIIAWSRRVSGMVTPIHWDDFSNDKRAATRQAILDCAAAIGEKMP